MSHLVKNPGNRFCRNEAQIIRSTAMNLDSLTIHHFRIAKLPFEGI